MWLAVLVLDLAWALWAGRLLTWSTAATQSLGLSGVFQAVVLGKSETQGRFYRMAQVSVWVMLAVAMAAIGADIVAASRAAAN